MPLLPAVPLETYPFCNPQGTNGTLYNPIPSTRNNHNLRHLNLASQSNTLFLLSKNKQLLTLPPALLTLPVAYPFCSPQGTNGTLNNPIPSTGNGHKLRHLSLAIERNTLFGLLSSLGHKCKQAVLCRCEQSSQR
jgi:hypothetical protein